MTAVPRFWTIPPGVPFLPTLARALCQGRLVPGFSLGDDPLALADATIFVPTRRAARELRASFVELFPGRPLVLPVIRALGEFDADDADFSPALAAADLPPPIPPVDRLLLLAPLVQRWKHFLPGTIRAMFQEEVEIPVSSADAVWLARDLASLMDEIETEETDWGKLARIVGDDLSGWWSVTLDFLRIVSAAWPEILAEKGRSNPAAHRNSALRAEAQRLQAQGARGPTVAAGSVACNPATAALFKAVASLPNGAVVLPGFDSELDARSWDVLVSERPEASVLGHPQFGLAKMLRRMGVSREAAVLEEAPAALAVRSRLLAEALRPAATTDEWAVRRADFSQAEVEAAFAGVTLVEAAHERDEALAIAIALRQAVSDGVSFAALATADRELARRVSAELARFGVRADDSGGTPLLRTPPGQLLLAMLEAVFRPGEPVAILSLLKHPLLGLGMERRRARRAAESIELLAFRGGAGRPDVTEIAAHLDKRMQRLLSEPRKPFWLKRMSRERMEDAGELARRLEEAVRPLLALRGEKLVAFSDLVLATVRSFEALGRDAEGGLDALYGADAGRVTAAFLRELVGAEGAFALDPAEWPGMMEALAAETAVRPLAPVADRRVAIWGLLEARLQHADTLVLGGLNEGAWPAKAQSDRFMSRFMKSGIELEPPENRIGLAAHDFQMAMGSPRVVLTRSLRQGDAPAVASRWLQRLATFLGKEAAAPLKARGDALMALARGLDEGERIAFEPRPAPKPPVEARPRDFSVTEIETLRRDPYAVYARRVLRLEPIEPLIREPGPAERGILFHRIMDRWTAEGGDAHAPDAREKLLAIGRDCFEKADLPADVRALWWPRFERMAEEVISWERERAPGVAKRFSEVSARKIEIGDTGATLRGRADRIDVALDGRADILDFKTGSSPTKAQAHSLLAPQMALEGALLRRGAFDGVGAAEPADLLFVRLKPDGTVEGESILSHNRQARTAEELSEEAWKRLERLIRHYQNPDVGYLSRTLPFKEGDASGPYDHLARVLEWSAGGGEEAEA